MTTHVKVSAAWQEVTTPYVKVGGTWQTVTNIYAKVGGTWQEVFGNVAPTVSPRADGDTNTILDVLPITCYVGCHFEANGQEYEITAYGVQNSGTTWLDTGSNSDVWVEFVKTGGNATSWDGFSNSTRYQLSQNRRFQIYAYNNSGGGVTKDIIGYFRMHDAASGGNVLWTGSTVTWRATATELTGPCSLC